MCNSYLTMYRGTNGVARKHKTEAFRPRLLGRAALRFVAFDVDGIDDAYYDRADGGLRAAKNLAGTGAFVEHQDAIADAGFDGGDGYEVAPGWFSGRIKAIND